jgi:hypothetical protein
MKKSILFSLALIYVHFLFGQNTYKQKLSDLATIDFPQKPDFRDTLGRKVFSFHGDSASYVALVMDISFDPNYKIKPGKLDEAYNEIINGTLRASKGKLVNKKKIKIDTLDGIEIEYISTSNPNQYDRRFKRIIFFNDKTYTYDYWTFSTLKDLTSHSREIFFNSFTILGDKKNLRQDTDTGFMKAYDIGYYIIGPLLILVILITIVYFIFKKRRK